MSFIVSADGSSTIYIRGVAVKTFIDLQTNNASARFPTNPTEEAWVDWASIPLVAPSLAPGTSAGVVSKRLLTLARDASSTATDYLALISSDPPTIDLTRAIPAKFDPAGSYEPVLTDATGATIAFDGIGWYINSMYETAGSALPNTIQGAVIFPGSTLPVTAAGTAPVEPLTLTYYRYEGTTGGGGGGGGGGIASVTAGPGIAVTNPTTAPVVALSGTVYNGNINYGLAGSGAINLNSGSTGSVQIGNDLVTNAVLNGINTTIGTINAIATNHTLNLLTGLVSNGLRTVNIGSGGVSTTAGLRAIVQIGPSASSGISAGTAIVRIQNADITNGGSSVLIATGSLVGTSNSRVDIGGSSGTSIAAGSTSVVNVLACATTGTGTATVNIGGGAAATSGAIFVNIGSGNGNRVDIGASSSGATTTVRLGSALGAIANIVIGNASADTTLIGGGIGSGGITIATNTPVTNLLTKLTIVAGSGTATGTATASPTGGITFIAGNNITLTGAAGSITIDAAAGGGGFSGSYNGALNLNTSAGAGTSAIGTFAGAITTIGGGNGGLVSIGSGGSGSSTTVQIGGSTAGTAFITLGNNTRDTVVLGGGPGTGSILINTNTPVTNLITAIGISTGAGTASGSVSATTTGTITLVAGTGISLIGAGATITINSAGGGGFSPWHYVGDVLVPDPASKTGSTTGLTWLFSDDISSATSGVAKIVFYSAIGAFHAGTDTLGSWSSSTALYATTLGASAYAEGRGSAVLGGEDNQISNGSDYSIIVGNNANRIGNTTLVANCVRDSIVGSYSCGIAPYNTLFANGTTAGQAEDSSIVSSFQSFIGNLSNNARVLGSTFSVIAASRRGYNGDSSSASNTNIKAPNNCIIVGGRTSTIVNGPTYSTIIGSYQCTIGDDQSGTAPPTFTFCSIFGGDSHNIAPVGAALALNYCTIVSGSSHTIHSSTSAAEFSTIVSGNSNTIVAASYSLINSGYVNTIQTSNAFDSNYNLIGNGSGNLVSDGTYGTILNGNGCIIQSANISNIQYHTILNGTNNSIDNINDNSGYSTIVNGTNNNIHAGKSIIAAGQNNTINSVNSGIFGGSNHSVSGANSVVVGGTTNIVNGTNGFAAGSHVTINGQGCFAWADNSTSATFLIGGSQTFNARASGGFYFYTDSGATVGVTVGAGGTSWSALSDRAAKENFVSIDFVDVLRRVEELPVTEWNYIGAAPGVRNIGPTAQDWQALFPLGRTELRIDTQEFDGVAIAAIKGLAELRRADAEKIAALEATVSDLAAAQTALTAQLAELAATVAALASSLQR